MSLLLSEAAGSSKSRQQERSRVKKNKPRQQQLCVLRPCAMCLVSNQSCCCVGALPLFAILLSLCASVACGVWMWVGDAAISSDAVMP